MPHASPTVVVLLTELLKLCVLWLELTLVRAWAVIISASNDIHHTQPRPLRVRACAVLPFRTSPFSCARQLGGDLALNVLEPAPASRCDYRDCLPVHACVRHLISIRRSSPSRCSTRQAPSGRHPLNCFLGRRLTRRQWFALFTSRWAWWLWSSRTLRSRGIPRRQHHPTMAPPALRAASRSVVESLDRSAPGVVARAGLKRRCRAMEATGRGTVQC